MRNTFRAAAVTLWLLGAGTANAGQFSTDTQVELQVAMQQYIDSNTTDNALLQVDPESAEINSYYIAKAHPKIMSWGDNAILCADFLDQNGKTVMANFYMAKRNGKFAVFQVTFGEDPVLMKLMQSGKVAMAN